MSKNKNVEVYLNRKAMGNNPKRIYSIRDKRKQQVIASSGFVLLKDVKLVVQKSGRNDTLNRLSSGAKITKTVHAFLRGTLLYRGRNAKKQGFEKGLNSNGISVGYDPVKTDTWLKLDGQYLPNDVTPLDSIEKADYALLHESGIYVI